MNKGREPHKQVAKKDNTLTSAQEVLYQKDFNKADEIVKDERKDRNKKSD